MGYAAYMNTNHVWLGALLLLALLSLVAVVYEAPPDQLALRVRVPVTRTTTVAVSVWSPRRQQTTIAVWMERGAQQTDKEGVGFPAWLPFVAGIMALVGVRICPLWELVIRPVRMSYSIVSQEQRGFGSQRVGATLFGEESVLST